MKKRIRIGLALVASLVGLAGCSDTPSPIAGPDFAIYDAAHGGTNGFNFLPPLVPAPEISGAFDATVTPSVQVCAGETESCVGSEVALFTTETGPGSETIRVDETEEQYVVNWHTDEFELVTGDVYRISVLVAGTLLGYADVIPAPNGGEMKSVESDEYIALKDGRTLPVKFRIEVGTVFPVGSSGATITAEDGAVVLEIPGGALSEEVGITIDPSGDVASGIGLLAGSVYDFEPDGLDFTEPASLTLAFELPDGLSASQVAVLDELASGEWEELVSSVDASANTVAAPIDGFSRKGAGKRADAVDLSPAAAELDLADNTMAQFSATVLDAAGAELARRKVMWAVGDESVATVDRNGLVTAIGDGTTYVEANAGQATARAEVAVGGAGSGTAGVLFTVGGGGELWRMDIDGSNATRLSQKESRDLLWASWSPDGSEILFGKDADIYKVNSDGTGEVNLTNNSADFAEFDPKWSPPSGGEIMFWGAPHGEVGDIYVMDEDGSNLTNLTSAHDPADADPDWSPDGSRIVFVRRSAFGNSQVFVMNADGSGATKLTDSGTEQRRPLWSPTGDKIVFWSNRAGSESYEYAIYVMNPDGSGLQQLSPASEREEFYVWSPDGTRLAVQSRRDGGDWDIFVLAADGSSTVNVTDHPARDVTPLWSLDGTQIYFVSDRTGEFSFDSKIYVMDADGSNVREVFDPEGTLLVSLRDLQ